MSQTFKKANTIFSFNLVSQHIGWHGHGLIQEFFMGGSTAAEGLKKCVKEKKKCGGRKPAAGEKFVCNPTLSYMSFSSFQEE